VRFSQWIIKLKQIKMSEEKEKGFFEKIKTQIVTGVGVILAGVGTMFMDEVKSMVGIGDDEVTVEQSLPQKQENTQTQSVNVTGPAITINIPEQKKDTVVKKIYVKDKPKPKEKEDLDW
jgi:hypothetical protein